MLPQKRMMPFFIVERGGGVYVTVKNLKWAESPTCTKNRTYLCGFIMYKTLEHTVTFAVNRKSQRAFLSNSMGSLHSLSSELGKACSG